MSWELGTERGVERRELWAIGEFAAAHGISIRQVYKLLKEGRLRGVCVGRRTLITNTSRVDWLASLPRFASSPAQQSWNKPLVAASA